MVLPGLMAGNKKGKQGNACFPQFKRWIEWLRSLVAETAS